MRGPLGNMAGIRDKVAKMEQEMMDKTATHDPQIKSLEVSPSPGCCIFSQMEEGLIVRVSNGWLGRLMVVSRPDVAERFRSSVR